MDRTQNKIVRRLLNAPPGFHVLINLRLLDYIKQNPLSHLKDLLNMRESTMQEFVTSIWIEWQIHAYSLLKCLWDDH